MTNDSSANVSKVWNYAHVLINAGVVCGDYVEQITYLLFLKLSDQLTDLGEFAKCKETYRFKKFTYDEIVARDKANLDMFWLKDKSLENSENLPPPAEFAEEITTSLEMALEEFRGVEEPLKSKNRAL